MRIRLLPNETVILSTRPSEWMLLPPLLIILVAIYFPWYFLIKYELAEQYSHWIIFWTALVFVYGLYKLIEWSNSRVVITSQRLISTSVNGFFNRQHQELALRYIQNVSVNRAGILGAFTRIGDVIVQGADAQNKLILKGIAQPHKIKDLLWQQTK